MRIGVVGATGLVGGKLIALLEETILPITELRLIASANSAGSIIKFKDKDLEVQEISDTVFKGLDLVFFMATNDIALRYVDKAVESGAVVIDNSSAFRMKEGVPLIVPEVNINKVTAANKVIANPNCSTIQLVVPLKVLLDIYDIERLDVSTYQAVSGAGKEAIDEYLEQINNYPFHEAPKVLPVKNLSKHYEIINNVIPQIDVFDKSGFTKEELKVVNESHKILSSTFPIGCTAVRVPVINGHSETVTVRLGKDFELENIIEAFKKAENLIVIDDIEEQKYPLASLARDHKEVYIGRIRKDLYDNRILHFFVVADNLLKGAASNALQIAEKCFNGKVYGWV